MSDLGWKVKGQPLPLQLINSHCLIRLNISSDYNDFGFNIFKKKTSLKKIPFECIRKQIWPWRSVGQCQHRIIIWTNLLGPTSPMLHTKSQGNRLLVLEKKIFKGFLPYMGVAAIWSWPANFCYPILRSLHMEFEFNWPSGFRVADVWKC